MRHRFCFADWLDENYPSYCCLGWLTHPGKIVDINLTPVQENWLHAGLLAGECAMFIMIAMVFVSLSKKFPIIYFILFTVCSPFFIWQLLFMYLLHCLNHIGGKSAAYLLILITIQVSAAFISLLKLNGNKNKHQATIKSIVNHPVELPKSYWSWNMSSTILRVSLHS